MIKNSLDFDYSDKTIQEFTLMEFKKRKKNKITKTSYI